MRALYAEEPLAGQPQVRLREMPVPDPGTGEVLLRMKASAVNYSDILTVGGAYRSRTTFPFVPGFEGVGEIVGSGDGGADPCTGSRVIPVHGAGCWQEFRVAKRCDCIPVPDRIPTEVATFSYINPMTAYLIVREVDPVPGTVALLSAPGSAMARYLSALLTARGVDVIGLSSGRSGTADLRGFVGHVVRLTESIWRDRLRGALPGGTADLLLDCVGGTTLQVLHDVAAPGARVVQYGLLSGDPQLPPSLARSGKFSYFHLRRCMYGLTREELEESFASVFRLFADGTFATPDFREVRLSDLAAEIVGSGWRRRPHPLVRFD